MSKEITDKDVRHAVKICEWRSEIGGVSVCKGMLGACEKVIESGKCDTLQKLFQKNDGGADNETD